jgi:hypothetical protein
MEPVLARFTLPLVLWLGVYRRMATGTFNQGGLPTAAARVQPAAQLATRATERKAAKPGRAELSVRTKRGERKGA